MVNRTRLFAGVVIVVIVIAFLLFYPVTPCLNMYGPANPCIASSGFLCADLEHNLTTGNLTMNATEIFGMNLTDAYFGYQSSGVSTPPLFTAHLPVMENGIKYPISLSINPPGQCVPVDGWLWIKYTYNNQTFVQEVASVYIGAGMESVFGYLFPPTYI